MNTNGKDIVTRTKGKEPVASLKQTIMAMMDQFKLAVPKTITPERMMRIAMTAVTVQPALANCTRESFFGALLTSAQLGLEPNTPLGHAYLIPYKNTCQLQVGYQGLIDLAHRSGKYKRIKSIIVHKGDDFEFEYGMPGYIKHRPIGDGEPLYVYALYEMTNGGGDFEVWSWKKVMDHGRQFSKSFNNGPWQTNPEEMAKKTVMKSLLKYAPKTVELATAADTDESVIEFKRVFSGDACDVYPEKIYPQDEGIEPDDPEEKISEKKEDPNTRKQPTEEEILEEAYESGMYTDEGRTAPNFGF